MQQSIHQTYQRKNLLNFLKIFVRKRIESNYFLLSGNNRWIWYIWARQRLLAYKEQFWHTMG